MKVLVWIHLLALASVAACGESQFASSTGRGGSADASSGQWRRVEETFTLENRSVDIFFALDTSASMLDEQQAVERNMKKFLDDILAVGIDVQVTALGSTDFHFPTDLPTDRFAVVNQAIGSRDVLKILTDFFAAEQFPLPMQASSQIEVVIISDDDAYNVAGYRAADFHGPKDKRTVVNAIVGLIQGENRQDCVIERRAENHIQLANDSGGKILDLCTPNWDDLVEQLGDAIIARNRAFDLQDVPDPDREITVTVDGVSLAASQFSIHADTKTITFAEDVVIGPQSIVKITYFVPNKATLTLEGQP